VPEALLNRSPQEIARVDPVGYEGLCHPQRLNPRQSLDETAGVVVALLADSECRVTVVETIELLRREVLDLA